MIVTDQHLRNFAAQYESGRFLSRFEEHEFRVLDWFFSGCERPADSAEFFNRLKIVKSCVLFWLGEDDFLPKIQNDRLLAMLVGQYGRNARATAECLAEMA